jgi:hypothetical protein
MMTCTCSSVKLGFASSLDKQSGNKLYTGLAAEAPAAEEAEARLLPLPDLARESKNSTALSTISASQAAQTEMMESYEKARSASRSSSEQLRQLAAL